MLPLSGSQRRNTRGGGWNTVAVTTAGPPEQNALGLARSPPCENPPQPEPEGFPAATLLPEANTDRIPSVAYARNMRVRLNNSTAVLPAAGDAINQRQSAGGSKQPQRSARLSFRRGHQHCEEPGANDCAPTAANGPPRDCPTLRGDPFHTTRADSRRPRTMRPEPPTTRKVWGLHRVVPIGRPPRPRSSRLSA